MITNDITKAKDPTMRGALNALLRAAAMARKIAIQTNTHLIIIKDGQLQRISADELRQQAEIPHTPAS
jgi:hypothetical protein